jgi:hypothetical protein
MIICPINLRIGLFYVPPDIGHLSTQLCHLTPHPLLPRPPIIISSHIKPIHYYWITVIYLLVLLNVVVPKPINIYQPLPRQTTSLNSMTALLLCVILFAYFQFLHYILHHPSLTILHLLILISHLTCPNQRPLISFLTNINYRLLNYILTPHFPPFLLFIPIFIVFI